MAHHNEPSLKDCRVLVVEDEYLIGDDLANALRALGAHVVGPVTELADAMSVEHDCFDVAVVDINLRGCSSLPVADEFMRVGKPFIFTTGYGVEIIPERFQHVRRWEKPYEIENVTADVAELCGERSL
ncbi:response regulator [Bradyrhizobium sp. CCGUVB23]|uniref:response regulator n=1 Tax=Bradyrhizobium sp. CCGUVB23 TaxID=2949630 RepID=UPI0020B34EE6|nr:response regulator [Bradyrhizobium sp. CCGUVB23]MCP3466469.1 response regulator [Bradyrhizobium sp. CCGUVB23]